MAPRKSKTVTPIVEENNDGDPKKRSKELEPRHFDSVIRYIKRASLGRVEALSTALHEVSEDLHLPKAKVIHGIPEGSDHFAGGSINTWAKSLTRHDRSALRQLAKILATAKARIEG